MDKTNERIVNGKAESKTYLAMVGCILLMLVGVVLLLLLPTVGFLVIMAGGYLIYMVKDGLSVEYEYTLINGDIDIAKILSKSRRKELRSIEVKDITYMDFADSDKVKNDLEVKKGQAVNKNNTDGFSQQDDTREGKPVAIYSKSGEKEYIEIFDFDEKCVTHMKDVLKMKCAIKKF